MWPHTQYLEVMQCPTNPTTAAAAQLVRIASAYHPNLLRYEGGDYSGDSSVCPDGASVASPTTSALPPAYVKLGESCLAEDPAVRPSFEEVVEALNVLTKSFVANETHVSDLSTSPSTPQQCHSEGPEMAIQDVTQESVSPCEPCPSPPSAAALQPQPFHSCLRNY